MNKVFFGDCRETMRGLIDDGAKVQTCVTSPPYYGLRDYGHPGQLGLESTPEEYVSNMVDVFRLVRELLADDGTLWLNIGDTYATQGGAHGGRSDNQRGVGAKRTHDSGGGDQQARRAPDGLKTKDLIGIPWMLAFALRADGWYLRQDIIWHKPNPMPESVRDRCTKAHEYIFLLSKSDRYFYQIDEIMEPVATSTIERLQQPTLAVQSGSDRVPGKTNGTMKAVGNTEKRNRRSVWTVATQPYKGAHFATFPPDLIQPCILAGSMPVGAYEPDDLILSPAGQGEREADPSMEVGRAGWSRPRRDVEAIRPMSRAEQAAYAGQIRNSPYRETMMQEAGGESTFAHYTRTDRSGARAIPPVLFDRWVDLGWLNQVSIPPALAAPHRSIVLDPFLGSGTVAEVSERFGRQWIGCELNPDYAPLQHARTAQKTLNLW